MTKGAKVDEKALPAEAEPDKGAMESITRVLHVCRAQMDELVVQLDLVKMNLRDELNDQADVAQNAFLAARSALSEVGHDAETTAKNLRQGLEHLIQDLERVYDEVDAVIRRGA
ncbi:MAG TPA: hypothetical protein VNG12_22530 [Acidimicrobiales bacterium]|nr:hypothetical protein [Acidimicrobiales bacterium]